MNHNLPFLETQRLTIWWVWLLLLSINGFSVYALVQQLGMGKPVGNNPVSDTGLIIIAVSFLLLTAGIAMITLHTKLDDQGVHFKLFPFHLKFRLHKWEDIQSAEVRQYKPIAEYGGWGLRMGPGGMAYNMSGNRGLQLVLKNGKRILIGTQKPEEISAFLKNRTAKGAGVSS